MYAKILLGTALAGLAGMLVVGAVNRTIARTNPEGGGLLGRAPFGEAGEGGQRRGPEGRAGGFGQEELLQVQAGLGQMRNQAGHLLPGAGHAFREDAWVALEGTVESVNPGSMTVELADGHSITVEGRAWSLAQEKGFSTIAKNRIILIGFFEGEGVFETAQIHDLSTSLGVALRDETGRPLWAGRGGGGASRRPSFGTPDQ